MPLEMRVLRLQPCPCSSADVVRADALRHDPFEIGRKTIASRALTLHQVAGRPDEELLLWRGKRTDLMEQGKAIRHAPVLNQLPVAEAANINHVDCNGLARMWIINAIITG